MKLELQEIRIDPIDFNDEVRRRLRIMMERLSLFYLGRINFIFQLENTNVILFYLHNMDTVTERKRDFFLLGKENENIGATQGFLSEQAFLQLDDEPKRVAAINLIHDVLTRYAVSTSHQKESLDEAYKRVLASDFYANSYKEMTNHHQNISCLIQSRENWGSADHRLVVKNLLKNEIKTYPITRTSYPFFDEMPELTQENMWKIVLNTPQTFNPIRWEGKKFVMYWGQEKYVFDPEVGQITQE